jgi:hypothetical protein
MMSPKSSQEYKYQQDFRLLTPPRMILGPLMKELLLLLLLGLDLLHPLPSNPVEAHREK